MRCVRLKFSKKGRAIYVSHLDINRMMTRAVRRAKIPMWYTEGFNPHPYIAFALPLSLGQESSTEYMDIRIEGDMTDSEILSGMKAALPEGVEILSAAEPVFSAKDIVSAKYGVSLDFENKDEAERFCAESVKLLERSELLAEKTGKKGHRKVLKQVNLIEQIFEKNISASDEKVNIECTLAAGNTVNLNPALLIETLSKCIGITPKQLHIVRKDLLMADGKSFC